MITSIHRIVFWGLTLGAAFSHAEVNFASNENAMRLEDLVVTGTRTPKSLKEGPVKTEVVTADEIAERRLRNAAEALLEVPGVTLTNATGKTGQSAILQGLGGDHVLVLLNGAPLLQNSSSGVDLTQISASDIERIEVVKGGASALYGGQAMGGVINILTKRPREGTHVELDVMKEFVPADQSPRGSRRGVGPETPNQITGAVTDRSGPNRWKLNVSRQAEMSVERDVQSITRDTPETEKNQIGLSYRYDISERRHVDLELGYANEAATTYTARLLPDATFRAADNRGLIDRVRARAGFQVSPDEANTVTMYVLGERVQDRLDLEDDPQTAYVESRKAADQTRWRIETQWDRGFGENHVVTFGAVAETQKLSQSTTSAFSAAASNTSVEIAERSEEVIEVFAQDDWILERGELISGLRFTHDPAFGLHADPKVSWLRPVELGIGSTSVLRTSLGTGFRRPSLKERYYLLDHRSFAGYVVYGDENLRPEESVSVQFGGEISQGEEYTFNANIFVNRVQGLITTTEIATGTSERAFRFANLERVRIHGFELAAGWKFARAWSASPSFVYTRAQDEGSGLIVPNRPFYTGQMNIRFEFPGDRGSLNSTLRYQGDAYADIDNTEMYPGFVTADLRYNWRWQRRWNLYWGIRNVFDQTRAALVDGTEQVFDQRPAAGRTFFVGMNFEG